MHLTTKQVALVLKRDVSTIRRMFASGRLKGLRYGRDWLIDERSFYKSLPYLKRLKSIKK